MASDAAERPRSLSPEQEAFDLSTTVDPSYIIQLIRRLLPSAYTEELVKQPSRQNVDDIADTAVDERRDINARISEQQGEKSSHSMDARVNAKRCKKDSENVLADHTENQSLTDETSPRVSRVLEKSQPSSSESELPLEGQIVEDLASNEENETTLGCSGVSDEQREEAGCMLWDLAATQSHAEFMVQNHILDVLLAILGISHSDRLREICLGVMGNLACHAEPVKAIVQTSGLPTEIVQSLFVDDAPSLSETCRLLSASLHSEQVDSWIKVINSREVLERVMWITANTMNSLLLEKSSELLLAMVDCQGSTTSVLSSLVHLGLPAVLTDLLASEIRALSEDTCSHGNVVLDTVLQIAEALSLVDEVAGQLADNLKLFTLACQVIQFSGKDEVGPAGISATVLVANLLAEREDLIHEVDHDVVLIKQLLELLPSASDDPGARNALWSILGRLSVSHVAAKKKGTSASTEISLAFAGGSKILLEDLQDHQDMEDPEEVETAKGYSAKLETVNNFLLVMEVWISANECNEENSDIHKTMTDSCSALKEWFKTIEVDATLKHDENRLFQNGAMDG